MSPEASRPADVGPAARVSTPVTGRYGRPADPALWQVLVAGVPALVVFAVPGVLAVTQGRRAMRLGRPDGRVPAVIGAVIALSFIGVNLLSYVATVVLG
ncbi:hypothetical protein [Nocardioides sp. LS1]|uniref:hypothetical protein n=1 Tax=Nocardioides sp. LS1 TaxID=1027620 RepID=UPI000F619BEA|nr:hypothetical protein [Nocardioides sp. LS1]GCD88230.1 hypothetical protein NLS1_02360 [Nocardioides sp. LS1]